MRSKVKFGLHEPHSKTSILFFQWSHLLALLSRNFLLDAAQNNEVTQTVKMNSEKRNRHVQIEITLYPHGFIKTHEQWSEGSCGKGIVFLDSLHRGGVDQGMIYWKGRTTIAFLNMLGEDVICKS